jgi:hypothetical protein
MTSRSTALQPDIALTHVSSPSWILDSKPWAVQDTAPTPAPCRRSAECCAITGHVALAESSVVHPQTELTQPS